MRAANVYRKNKKVALTACPQYFIFPRYAGFICYPLSDLKCESQTFEILGKTLLLLNDRINNKQTGKNELMEGIKIANGVIIERQSLLKNFKKFDNKSSLKISPAP